MKTLSCVRSSYSFLNSLLSIPQIVSLAKERGYEAIILSDQEVLYGANEFMLECQKQGVKPIYSIQCSIGQDVFFVLAKNNEGFKQLIQLSLILSDDELNIETLSKHSTQCIVIYSSENSRIETELLSDNIQGALKTINDLSLYFREFRIGFSLMESVLFSQKNQQLIQACQLNNYKTVALETAYYPNPEDEEMLKIVQAIDSNVGITDSRLLSQPYHSLLSYQERVSLYDDLTNQMTDELSLLCSVELTEFKTKIPKYQNDYQVDSKEFLKQLSIVGLRRRLNNQVTQEYNDRLKHELSIIEEMGFEDYFLIVYDFILFAKKNDILVGPGRGSAAGSLVAYSLGITEIDPLKYDLIFERFLNPERLSMPDIDTDFEDTKRNQVIAYVVDKYGLEHVAHIVTFSTLTQKQVIIDVGKVLGLNPKIITEMTQALIDRPKMTLSQSLSDSPKLREIINTRADAKRVFEIALKLEGLPRQKSIHPAGMVMSYAPLGDVLPILKLNDSIYCTQYTMNELEPMGLVKMDFLGLSNLSIITEVLNSIKQQNPDFDLKKISLLDQKTYRLLAEGLTLGIFQLESKGMINLLREIRPHEFKDIVDAIALYRPGPMQNRSTYINNRKNPEDIQLIHPKVDPILKSTYGVLIYQEQILQIAREFAGFSYAKADVLRSAIAKKNNQQMDLMMEEFLKAKPSDIAQQLWDLIKQFAAYGFNKAHSVSYAKITYQMAYLKANYPLYFYKAILNSVKGSSRKLKETIKECHQRKIKLLGPSINHSYAQFKLEEGGIRLCLTMIKSIGDRAAIEIENARYQQGFFRDYFDAVARLNKAKINQSQIENLIHAGAFDDFNLPRYMMILNLPEVLKYAEIIKIELDQQTLLDYNLADKPTLISAKDNSVQLSRMEMEVLGFHFSTHPVLSVKQRLPFLKHQVADTSKGLGHYMFYATISSMNEILTKNRKKMAFVIIEDEWDSAEAVIFPETFARFGSLIDNKSVYKISGQTQINNKTQNLSFSIRDIERIEP